MSSSVTCSDKCYPIGRAVINSTFIVGCSTLPRCASGARHIKPGEYSMYRDKLRKSGVFTR